MGFESMDELCGSPFWDGNLTWYTESPELTSCSEQTVLAWVPCIFLWIAAPLEVYYMYKSNVRNVPWSPLNVTKINTSVVLALIALADLLFNMFTQEVLFPVQIITPVIRIATYILSAALVYYLRVYGLRTSGVLFIFYVLSFVALLSPLRGVITSIANPLPYAFYSTVIHFILILLSFLLSCFADLPPKKTPYTFHKTPCPESASGFPSRLTFSWLDPLIFLGFKRDLREEDLWALNPEDASANVVPRFAKFWKRTLDKHDNSQSVKARFTKSSASVDITNRNESRKPASILPPLCLAFGGQFLFGAFLKLLNDLMTFVPPQLLKYLINFVEGQEPMWRGYLYAAAFLLTASLQTLVLAHYFTRMYLVGMKIRTALTSAIYRKALKLSNAARRDSTVGEIVNLMAVDAQRFLELMAYINMIWSAPLQISLALYFLWDILGPAVLAGLAVMIILIPVNGVIANRVKTLQIKQMKYKDERVKLMNEVLNGIKVLKMYAWEPSYQKQITEIRDKEMRVLKQSAYLNSATSFIWSCAPFLVTFMTFFVYVISDPEKNVLDAKKIFVSMSLFYTMNLPLGLLPLVVVSAIQVSIVSFACFVLISDDNVLDSKTAFVSLSLFNILRFPLSMLPNVISNIIQTSVGVKRLNKFMNAEELDPDAVEKVNEKDTSMDDCSLTIENGCFNWGGAGTDTFELRNVNLRIKSGSLVGVVGAVGSGKSSLLAAALGELSGTGRVRIKGSIASVPQQPWIRNATLKDNVLFGNSGLYDEAKYNDVIERCALGPDLATLPAGDNTEIGEKGVNLSGGQKARVALARALFAERDVYFLDDPLSAVDAHVGKHLFERAIGPNSVIKNTTRIWATHSVTYLPKVDYIIVLKDGRVAEEGTFRELLEKKGDFADFLLTHLSTAGEDAVDDEIKQELESKLGGEFREKLERARSQSESASEHDSTSPDRKASIPLKRSESSAGVEQAQPKAQQTTNKLIEAEKAETGSVKWSVYKHYLISVGVVAVIVTILMNMILQVFQIGSNYWLADWSNDKLMVVDGVLDKSRRDMYLGVYGALGVGQAFASFFADLLPYLSGWRAAKILHQLLLASILRCPMSFFDTTPIGRILGRFSKDIDVVDLTLPMGLADSIYCLSEVIATLVVISSSTPIFMVLILPIGILYYIIQRIYVATSRQLKRLESISRSPIYSHFGESLTGASTIRAYGLTERFVQESDMKVDHNQECYYPSCIANRWLAVRLEMIGNLIIFFSALFAVLARNTVNPGLVGLSVSYALQITQTLNWLVRMTSDVETNIVAVERIKEYSEIGQEAAWDDDGSIVDESWPKNGAVELQALTIAYRPDSEPVLKDITCNIRPGEKVGVVGRTGAGKSTLALALFRIVEATSGRICVDGADVALLGLGRLRSRVTVIPQDPVLFSGSLRTNLDPFDKHSDSDLWHALELSGLRSMAESLPAGLRHQISEGGDNLSLGQRQLVCLARALLRQSKLLLLDEATAAVDLDTDAALQRTIRSEFRDATVLTIAHRIDTIMDYDRIMVLDKGKLVEFDSPSNLMADRTTMFYSLAREAGIAH